MISIRGGWRVAALLVAVLAGTVSGAGAVSKPLMTRLMQTSPTDGTPEPGSLTAVVAHGDPQPIVDNELGILRAGGASKGIRLFVLFPAATLSIDSADWSAQSSDTGVATVEFFLRGQPSLTVRPVGRGETTITAGYTGNGNSVSYSFTVTVAARAPVTGGDDPQEPSDDPLTTVSVSSDPQAVVDDELGLLRAGGDLGVIRLFRLFSAATLSIDSADWSAQSSDTGVVTVEFIFSGQRPWLRVRPVGRGEATIRVGYTGNGNSVSSRFAVTVAARASGAVGEPGADGAPAPVANVQAVVNEEVGDQAGGLEPGGRSVAIDVNDLFVNVGGATGRDFSATSSDGRVVTVEVTDNPHVVIRPVGEGLSTVTVRYTAGGTSVRASFGVAVGEGFVRPVPALPLAAAGLLAALLFGAGLRRRRRSR